MNPETLSTLSTAANGDANMTLIFSVIIFAWLVIKEILKYVGGKTDRRKLAGEEDINRDTKKKIDQIYTWTERLHEMHDKTDEDGVPVWYVRRSLEKSIEKLADNIDKQTDVFKLLIDKITAKVDM